MTTTNEIIFLKFTLYDGHRLGETIRILLDQIAWYEPVCLYHGSRIYLKGGATYRVIETAEEIDKLISSALR